MKGNYKTERHRRKVMREMRLAGYDLPGTPYRRVNRSYSGKKNKSSKVRTTKVVYSMTVKGRKVSDAQRKAIWAKMNQSERVPPKGWNEAARIRKQLEATGLIKKDTKEDIKKGVEEINDQFFIPMVENLKTKKVKSVDINKGSYGPGTNLYSRCKYRAIDRLKQEGKQIPPEDSYQMRKLILAEHAEITESMKHSEGLSESDRKKFRDKFLETCNNDENGIAEKIRNGPYNAENAVIESKLANKELIDNLKYGMSRGSNKFGSFLKPPTKAERQEEREIEREKLRNMRLAVNQQRQEELERKRIERVQKPKEAEKPIIYTPIEQPTESPAARAKRLAREASAKEESKKASKELRYSKKTFHTRSAVRKKHKASSAYSVWGDLIESQPKPKRKPRKAKKTHRTSSAATSRKKKNIFDTMGKDISKGVSSIYKKKRTKKGKGFMEFIGESREKTRKYKAGHKEEIAAKQAERRQAIEETKQELKMKGEKVKTDVSKAVKKFENPDVVGPGYDRWGHPIKGYKVKTVKPEVKEEEEE